MSSYIKDKKLRPVSMRKDAIINIDIKIWTWKTELPQGNLLCSLTQAGITIQRPFKLTDIDYDQIRDEIARMECVYNNNAIVRSVMNFDNI